MRDERKKEEGEKPEVEECERDGALYMTPRTGDGLL